MRRITMQHDESAFNEGLLRFLKESPTPFHAVAQMGEILDRAGFVRVAEADRWRLQKGSRYYVTRNDSAIIAFTTGDSVLGDTGFRMVGAHTDSPCLKVKPKPEIISKSYLQLGVEVYGGALLNPWFDRDLSLAGRVSYLSQDNGIQTAHINFRDPVAYIPSLAIHLDSGVNKKRSINEQTNLRPILTLSDQRIDEKSVSASERGKPDFREILREQIQKEYADAGAEFIPAPEPGAILDYELCLYDTQPPGYIGLKKEFIAGARLDNLLSCYIGLMSLTQAGTSLPSLLIANDHEEVGSLSTSGAQGSFLVSVLRRLCPAPDDFSRTMARSVMISSDNAHGVHPNYANKYDDNHGPVLNRGPVIKVNAKQRYASDSETSAWFRYLCQKANIPVQTFAMRSDMPCGSTIGPLTAAKIGIKTADVGVPTFGMHSVRELAGEKDGFYLYKVLKSFFETEGLNNERADNHSG